MHSCFSADIYEGNVKLILGLLWSLFRRFKIQTISTDNKSSEEGLLLWVKSITVAPQTTTTTKNNPKRYVVDYANLSCDRYTARL